MNPPFLTVIAGCNGSGKSSFSRAFETDSTKSFDYDKVFLEKYNSLLDSEFRDTMAHNMARQYLESQIKYSIDNKLGFLYETNFNSTPLYWPEKFRTEGYKLRLVYFCLNSINEAIRRVQIRVENGGHFVPEYEIKERYYLGFKHLNNHWDFFDEVYLFDTSKYNHEPTFLLSIFDKKIKVLNNFESYLTELIPNIEKLK